MPPLKRNSVNYKKNKLGFWSFDNAEWEIYYSLVEMFQMFCFGIIRVDGNFSPTNLKCSS